MRPDWTDYLHDFKRREIDLAFANVPAGAFARGLELGAGDGFQSTLLIHYVASLVSTDCNPNRLVRQDTLSISYRICDAEEVGRYFEPTEFDLIFSSSLLEHLPAPGRALEGMRRVLDDEGIMVHLMPTPFWKWCQMTLFYPLKVMVIAERLSSPKGRRKLLRRLGLGGAASLTATRAQAPVGMGNNPKMERKRVSRLRALLWPVPHGAYNSNVAEVLAYRKRRWVRLMEDAGFDMVRVMRGPVTSGYGLGFRRTALALERLGFASVYAYVAVKQGYGSPLARYFK